MKSGVYSIINKINNKVYIGSSRDLIGRYKMHVSSLKKGKHHSIKLQNSVNKHGLNNFKFKIIEFVDLENIIEREQYWIDYYDSANKGYNICPKAYSCLGRIMTKEHKLKISKANKGRQLNIETKNKIVKKLKERFKNKENHPSFGKKMSQDTKDKISKANTGKDRPLEAIEITIKKQRKIKPEDMPIIKEMLLRNTHCNIIAEKYNVNVQTIWRIRQGKHTLSNLINGGYNNWILEKLL